jgi:hypothetical protein
MPAPIARLPVSSGPRLWGRLHQQDSLDACASRQVSHAIERGRSLTVSQDITGKHWRRRCASPRRSSAQRVQRSVPLHGLLFPCPPPLPSEKRRSLLGRPEAAACTSGEGPGHPSTPRRVAPGSMRCLAHPALHTSTAISGSRMAAEGDDRACCTLGTQHRVLISVGLRTGARGRGGFQSSASDDAVGAQVVRGHVGSVAYFRSAPCLVSSVPRLQPQRQQAQRGRAGSIARESPSHGR